MTPLFTWIELIIAVLIIISTTMSMKKKNPTVYQSVLYTVLLLEVRCLLKCFELLFAGNDLLVKTFITCEVAMTPIIATIFITFSFSAINQLKRHKFEKRIFALLGIFFGGIIITNPIHNVVFEFGEGNQIIEGSLWNLPVVYSAACLLVGFIIIAIGVFINEIKTGKLWIFAGGLLALGATPCLLIKSEYDLMGIATFIIGLLIYFYIFKENDYNFLPIIRDNTFELINDPVLVFNCDLAIKEYNKQLTKLFPEIDFSNVLGRKIEDVFKFYPILIYSAKNLEQENIIINDKEYSMESYSSIEKRKKNVIHTLTFKTVTALTSNLEKIANDTATDKLTRLKTKEYFIDMVTFEYKKALKYNMPFTMMLMDVDGFEKINEQYGHIASDLLLSNIAIIVQKEIRTSDVLARYDNDVFALLLTNTNCKYAELVATRIKDKVEEAVVSYDGKKIKATLSIGVAGSNKVTSPNFKKMLTNVEAALQDAKDQGSNRIVLDIEN